MIKKIQKKKTLYFKEKSYIYYLSGISIFLLLFIYYLFDRTILIEKNIISLTLSLITFIFFLIGFILDSIKFIKNIWSTYYGKIFHFIIASIVYALSYSLSEKIIFINTQLDPNLLQSSIYLFTSLLNLPVWLLIFQIFLIVYTFLYSTIIFISLFIYFIYLCIKYFISEISKNFISWYSFKNLIYKNKQIRVNIRIMERKILLKKRQFIIKIIHSFFFIIGGSFFIIFFPIDQKIFNSMLKKENNIIKNIIISTSFYRANGQTCINLDTNVLVRFYGNSFSKIEYKNGEIIFINNIKCE